MVENVSDFKMPEKVVSRLLKDSLPDNVIISKDAKNAACRAASIFILQLSIAAAEKAQRSNRDTLDSQDIIKAVTDLGLGEYAPQLVRFGAQRKRNAKRRESNVNKSKAPKKLVLEDIEHESMTPEMNEPESDTSIREPENGSIDQIEEKQIVEDQHTLEDQPMAEEEEGIEDCIIENEEGVYDDSVEE